MKEPRKDERWEVYNPLGKDEDELTVIYGFDAGGIGVGDRLAALVSEDGRGMGSHLCSSEAWIPNDLGILKGSRPDRHEGFKKDYPDGYRMVFIGSDEEPSPAFKQAMKLNKETRGEGAGR